MNIMSLEVLTDYRRLVLQMRTRLRLRQRVVYIFIQDAYACEDRRSDPEAIRISGKIIQRYCTYAQGLPRIIIMRSRRVWLEKTVDWPGCQIIPSTVSRPYVQAAFLDLPRVRWQNKRMYMSYVMPWWGTNIQMRAHHLWVVSFFPSSSIRVYETLHS